MNALCQLREDHGQLEFACPPSVEIFQSEDPPTISYKGVGNLVGTSIMDGPRAPRTHPPAIPSSCPRNFTHALIRITSSAA